MADNEQTAAAWEMLSSVVVMRAKARENKLPKLLSSLHGVEVELARIIAGSSSVSPQGHEVGAQEDEFARPNGAASEPMVAITGDGAGLQPVTLSRSRTKRAGTSQADQKLHAYSKRYLALARQLRDLVRRGEVVASRGLADDSDVFGDDLEAASDPLLAEQHELSLTISRLKATTFEGLADKAAVLDDLVEEGSDDPVQALARSLARDIIAMPSSRKAAI